MMEADVRRDFIRSQKALLVVVPVLIQNKRIIKFRDGQSIIEDRYSHLDREAKIDGHVFLPGVPVEVSVTCHIRFSGNYRSIILKDSEIDVINEGVKNGISEYPKIVYQSNVIDNDPYFEVRAIFSAFSLDLAEAIKIMKSEGTYDANHRPSKGQPNKWYVTIPVDLVSRVAKSNGREVWEWYSPKYPYKTRMQLLEGVIPF